MDKGKCLLKWLKNKEKKGIIKISHLYRIKAKNLANDNQNG